MNDKRIEIFNEFVEFLKEKHGVDLEDIGGILRGDEIPVSIFNERLSAMESIVKYLREEKGFSYRRIGEILYRNEGPIGVTYRNSKKKMRGKFKIEFSKFSIPFSAFNAKLTVFEAVVFYLREKHGLKYNLIGKLLKRNERTVWTVYQRAKVKNEK